MHTLAQLQKQQVGLRLHKYLVDDIDAFTKKYNLNRTDIIEEAIKSYLAQQKEYEFYAGFDAPCKELQEALQNPKKRELQSLETFINELED
jgi:hypothetical protein